MAERPPDIDELSIADLKRLLLEALAKIADLTAENAALREEIARLKGLKGRPVVKPSQTADIVCTRSIVYSTWYSSGIARVHLASCRATDVVIGQPSSSAASSAA